jgi:hypothetical protein
MRVVGWSVHFLDTVDRIGTRSAVDGQVAVLPEAGGWVPDGGTSTWNAMWMWCKMCRFEKEGRSRMTARRKG